MQWLMIKSLLSNGVRTCVFWRIDVSEGSGGSTVFCTYAVLSVRLKVRCNHVPAALHNFKWQAGLLKGKLSLGPYLGWTPAAVVAVSSHVLR